MAKIPFVYKRASVPTALQRVAPFMNRDTRQMSYYAAGEVFGFLARLTAFKSARNIIRIRTK
jgi:hypothetical protein